MSEIASAAAATETPPGAQPSDAGTGTVVERPEGVPEKFWDAEGGKLRDQDLLKSYTALEGVVGRRIQEVSAETRRLIAEALPDEVKGAWAEHYKSTLVADPEFLTPLEEAWKAKNLPQAPATYEPPTREDGASYDQEHPLYAAAVEMAKKHGLPQTAFAELMDLTYQARADYETPPDLGEWKASIPDIEPRAKAVYNRLLGVSPDHAATLINQVRDPNAFLALEAIVKASGPKSLTLEAGVAEPPVTQGALDAIMLDPKYYRDHDADLVAKVQQGYKRLYGDTI